MFYKISFVPYHSLESAEMQRKIFSFNMFAIVNYIEILVVACMLQSPYLLDDLWYPRRVRSFAQTVWYCREWCSFREWLWFTSGVTRAFTRELAAEFLFFSIPSTIASSCIKGIGSEMRRLFGITRLFRYVLLVSLFSYNSVRELTYLYMFLKLS